MKKLVQGYILIFPYLSGVFLYLGVSIILSLLAFDNYKNRANHKRGSNYFVIIFVCGLLSGILHEAFLTWIFLRDLLIFLHLLIFFRWFSNCSYPNYVLSWIATSAFCYTFFLFFPFLLSGSLFNYSYMSRYDFDLESNLALIGLLSVLVNINFYKRGKFSYSIVLILFFIFFILISASRINIVLLICFCMLFFYKRYLPYWVPLFLVLVGLVSFVFFYKGSENTFNDTELSFLGKLSNTFSEISINPQEGANVNFLWRSHEAYLGLSEFLNSSFSYFLIGKGFGSFVDGSALFDNKYQQIPFFHNGFVTVLFKTGLIGISSFFMFLIMILRTYKTDSKILIHNKKFFSYAIVLLIFSTTLTIMGFYTTEFNSFLIILASFSSNKYLF